jgi:hypothetical protein
MQEGVERAWRRTHRRRDGRGFPSDIVGHASMPRDSWVCGAGDGSDCLNRSGVGVLVERNAMECPRPHRSLTHAGIDKNAGLFRSFSTCDSKSHFHFCEAIHARKHYGERWRRHSAHANTPCMAASICYAMNRGAGGVVRRDSSSHSDFPGSIEIAH